MHDAIRAQNVTIVREGLTVLKDVSFGIPRGKITGLIGPSGSGKTTLMRAIVGAQRITKGELLVNDIPAGRTELRSKIGYVTQTPAIYNDLTVKQNLQYFAAVAGQDKEAVMRAIARVDLNPQTNQLVSSLSGGQQARVSLAIALLGNAEVLVLDEPTVGLDPVLRHRLWKLFAELANEDKALLISSHVMDEAEQCPEIILLRDGQILSHSTKAMLFERSHTQTVEDAFITLIEQTAPSDPSKQGAHS